MDMNVVVYARNSNVFAYVLVVGMNFELRCAMKKHLPLVCGQGYLRLDFIAMQCYRPHGYLVTLCHR